MIYDDGGGGGGGVCEEREGGERIVKEIRVPGPNFQDQFSLTGLPLMHVERVIYLPTCEVCAGLRITTLIGAVCLESSLFFCPCVCSMSS